MTHHQPIINRRLERHRRMDGSLQARARPVSLERKANSVDEGKAAAQAIRGWVEDRVDELEKRLLLGGGGGDSGGSSNGGTGNSNSRDGSGSDGPSTTGGNSGSSGNGGNSGNGGDGSAATTVGGRPGGFDTSTTSSPTRTRNGDPFGFLTSTSTRSSTSSSSTHSTSTSTHSTSTSSSSSQVLTVTPTSTSSAVLPSTSVAYVTSSPLPTLNNAAATPSQSSQNDDSGPGAGPIIGIVAGALAGVAVLAALIGFIIKRKSRKEDPYEADPFDRDSFRRQSAMLPETFEDDDFGGPDMSEAHHNMGPGSMGGHMGGGPFVDEQDYMNGGAAAMAGAGIGSAAAFTARNEAGGPRPPTMFQKHINAPAAQRGLGGDHASQNGGAIYVANGDPTPQLPVMAFGGSDPYSLAGVGRPNFDNVNNPYGYLDRSKSGAARASPPHHDQFVEAQEYASLDRSGSHGSSQQHEHYQQQQQHHYNGDEDYSYGHHDTAGRPGTAEGRSGTPDLPNMQQTYAMGHADGQSGNNRVSSPHHMMASPQHMSQDFLSNGMQQRMQQQQEQHFQQDSSDNVDPYSNYPSPPQQQPLQVRNLLPNPNEQLRPQHGQRPVSSTSEVDDEAAYGGVW